MGENVVFPTSFLTNPYLALLTSICPIDYSQHPASILYNSDKCDTIRVFIRPHTGTMV